MVALVLAALLGLPRSAAAHIRMTASTPAAGSAIASPIHEIRITFSERVATKYTSISIIGPAGVEVPVLSIAPADTTLHEFVATLGDPLPNGAYVVRWRTAGPDGHVVSGEFSFTQQAPALEPQRAQPIPVTPGIQPPGTTVTDGNSRPLAVAVRFFNFLALLLAIGVVAFRAVILPAVSFSSAPEYYWKAVEAAVRRAGILAAAFVLLIALPRFLLQSSALYGAELMFEPGRLNDLLFHTTWGIGWLLQVAAGVGLLIAAWWRLRLLAVASVIALALSPALSGHAAAVQNTTALSVFADAVHVAAAATWLGSLAMILLLVVPITLRTGPETHGGLAAAVRAYSPIALLAATVIVLTGAAAGLFHLTRVSQLWTTRYGQVLLIKLAIVGLVAAVGLFNWKRVRPTLGEPAASLQLRRTIRLELAFATLVVLVTAVLVTLAPPAD